MKADLLFVPFFTIFATLCAIQCVRRINRTGNDFLPWSSWSACASPTNVSDGCNGVQTRTRECGDANGTVLPVWFCIGIWTEDQDCFLTSANIDGGWSGWGQWACTSIVNGTRVRTRKCDNPIKCNAGANCTGSKEDYEVVTIDGNWGKWSAYSPCSVTVSHGTSTRVRSCSDPPQCGGDTCLGDAIQQLKCEIIPEEFSGPPFGDKYQTVNTSLIFYGSANIHIFPTAVIKECCFAGFKHWTMYKVEADGNETLIQDMISDSYPIPPGTLSSGIHRLYLHYALYHGSNRYVYGWMYLQSIYPPPFVFIKGGSGRVVGHGNITLNARDVSYDLTLGPGHSDNLNFSWTCHEFFTSELQDLVGINLNPVYTFEGDDEKGKISWETMDTLRNISTSFVKDKELFINLLQISEAALSFNYEALDSFKDMNNMPCSYILTHSGSCPPNATGTCLVPTSGLWDCGNTSTSVSCFNEMNNTCFTGIDLNETQTCLDYLKEACTLESEYSLYVWNISEYDNLIFVLRDPDLLNEIESLQSTLESRSRYLFAGKAAFARKMNTSFINETDELLQELGTLVRDLSSLHISLSRILEITGGSLFADTPYTYFADFITDCYNLSTCTYTLPETLVEFYRISDIINTYKPYDLNAEIEKLIPFYGNMFTNGSCGGFEWNEMGFAEINMENNTINMTIGFIVTVKASVINSSTSISYFQQNIQIKVPPSTTPGHIENGGIPKLDIECRLNCKQQIASSSVISLRAICSSCKQTELDSASYSWNLQEFDMYSRNRTDIRNWTKYLETDPKSQKFVLKANSLSAGSNYLVTVHMLLNNGESSESMLILETTQPPYSNLEKKCEMRSNNIYLFGWMDEGFRDQRDPRFDWKEQLTFRVLQRDRKTNLSTLLYYGREKLLTEIHLNEGYAEDDYKVEVYIQIFDIFDDYADCSLKHIKVPPKPIGNLTMSTDGVAAAYSTGNIKVVSMLTETSANSIVQVNFPRPTSMNPSTWSSIGVVTETTDNSTNSSSSSPSTPSFNDTMALLYPDVNVTLKESLSQVLQNLSDIMTDTVKYLQMSDIVSLRQTTHTLGTLMGSEDLVDDEIVGSVLDSSDIILDRLRKFQIDAKFPVYEEYYGASDDVLRTLDNVLNGCIPNLSADVPSSSNAYELQQSLQLESQFSEEDNAFSQAERALFLSLITEDYIRDLNHSESAAMTNIPHVDKILKKLGVILDEISFRKQLPIYVEKPGLKSSMHQTDTKGLSDEITFNDAGIKMSPNSGGGNRDYSVQVTLFDKNPYIWDDEAKYISSETMVVNTLNETNMMASTIRLPNKGAVKKTNVLMAFPIDPLENINQIFFVKAYWKKQNDNLYININALANQLRHIIYVRCNKNPTDTEYDWTTSVSSSMWNSEGFLVNVPGGLCGNPCIVYIAVRVHAESINGTVVHHRSKRSALSFNTTNIVTYSVQTWLTGCRVWNSGNNRWDGQACSVDPSSTASHTVCSCPSPPGNTFATTFYVPPNMIDFSSVFYKFDIVNNGAVFGTVIALIVLFALLVVWTRRKDINDISKCDVSYLADNLKGDDYLYVLTVTTGISLHSGTKSNVKFILTSETRETGVRELHDGFQQGFPTGSVRRFVMSTPKCIGDIRYLHIWHDNSGKWNEASWNLKQVLVEDVQTDECFTFFCNEWLTLNSESGRIEKSLPVADATMLSSFGVNFQQKTRENTTESHLWLSVILRPEKNAFTRLQRLSCCWVVLFLAMISNAMFFGQDNSIGQIKLGPITFSLAGLYISLISIVITAPPVLLLTFLFKHSREKKETQNLKLTTEFDNIKDNKGLPHGSQKQLPYGFRYVAWALVILAILVSGFFVILYSMEWGKHKSEEWLKCFFLSWCQSIFIVDPLKVIAISIVLSICLRKKKSVRSNDYHRQHMLQEAKERAITSIRVVLNSPSQGIIMNNDRIETLRLQRKAELKTRRVMVELVAYLLLLTVMYIICISNRDPLSFNCRHNINTHLLGSVLSNSSRESIRFNKVQSVSKFYEWMDLTLLPFVFPIYSNNGDTLSTYDGGFLADGVNYRVGPLRLRQLRSRKTECLYLLYDDMECYDNYGVLQDDEEDYCIGWKPSSNCTSYISYENISLNAWKFTSSEDIWGMPITGEVATYGGGGYIAELGVNQQVSKKILSDLMHNNWVDRRTRVVAIEMTVYNANINLFTYMSLLAEFPEFGGILTSNFVNIFRIHQHLGDIGVFVFICEMIFALAVVIASIRLGIDIYKNKCAFFKDAWKFFDFVILLLTLFAIAIYIARMVFANKTINEFLKNKYKPVNFAHIATWDEVFMVFAATIVSLTTVRLMRVLSYNQRLTEIVSVLSHGARDLIGCFILFFTVLIAYICLGYLVFGKQLDNYRNLFVSFTTIVNALIGRNNIRGLLGAVPIIAQVYYFTFNLFVLWILMTMLNATLNKSISIVRKQNAEPSNAVSYGLTDFIKQTCLDATTGILAIFSNKERKNGRPMTSLTAQDVELEIEDLCDSDVMSMNDDVENHHEDNISDVEQTVRCDDENTATCDNKNTATCANENTVTCYDDEENCQTATR